MSASPPSQSTSRRHAWERWVIIWHAAFYLMLALPTLLYLLSGNVRQSLGLVLGLTLALGLWYGVIMVWLIPKVKSTRQTLAALIFLAGALVLWVPLTRAYPAYYLTATSFYGLMWGTLPFWMAIAGNVLLTGLIIWLQAISIDQPVTISANLLIIGAVIIGWSVLLAFYVRTIMRESVSRKRLIVQLEAAQEELAIVERQAGVLEERQRMAGEIHDTLAQGFTSIVMQLEAAEEAMPGDLTAVRDRIQKARETARVSLGEARRLVKALQPEQLEAASLPEALNREAIRWEKNTGINTKFSVTGEPMPLHPEIEVTLLRAMQEGLTNVHKHAQASEVMVTLSYMDEEVALDIQDDGGGFEPQAQLNPKDGGFGLQAMRQRAESIDGSVIVESSPEKGTTLVVQLPIVDQGSGENEDGQQ